MVIWWAVVKHWFGRHTYVQSNNIRDRDPRWRSLLWCVICGRHPDPFK